MGVTSIDSVGSLSVDCVREEIIDLDLPLDLPSPFSSIELYQ